MFNGPDSIQANNTRIHSAYQAHSAQDTKRRKRLGNNNSKNNQKRFVFHGNGRQICAHSYKESKGDGERERERDTRRRDTSGASNMGMSKWLR